MADYIRASSTTQFGDCARRWAAGNLTNEVKAAGFELPEYLPPSIGAGVGNATHSGAGYMLLQKIDTGTLGNFTEAEHRAMEEIDEATAKGVLWDDATANKNDAQKQVVRMLHSFADDLAPKLTPQFVERRLQADFGDGFTVTGQSDLQAISPVGIDDIKTGKRSMRHWAQIGTYSLLARTVHPGLEVKQLRTLFIQRTHLSKPQPKPVIEAYDQYTAEQAAFTAIAHIKRAIEDFRERVAMGNAPPEHAFLANPASNLCNPKYCKAWGTTFCREHKTTFKE